MGHYFFHEEGMKLYGWHSKASHKLEENRHIIVLKKDDETAKEAVKKILADNGLISAWEENPNIIEIGDSKENEEFTFSVPYGVFENTRDISDMIIKV